MHLPQGESEIKRNIPQHEVCKPIAVHSAKEVEENLRAIDIERDITRPRNYSQREK